MNERGSYKYTSYMTNVCFASAIRSLGKYYFLPSLANRMIRMSKDEEMRKNERNDVLEGSQVESKPK